MFKKKTALEIWENVWVPTICGRRYCACGTRVYCLYGDREGLGR